MRLALPLTAALAPAVAACTLAATAPAAPATSTISAPITAVQSGGALAGVFQITSFTLNQAGQLVANGSSPARTPIR